jgi:ubiquinone/menaquinone biosynthesis C-methylase UbiE
MAGNPVVHNSAHLGFDNAQAYDAHRPSYPAEAVHKLLEQLELVGKGGSKIVDLAAGTGKFTELLAARPEQYEIVAVEPLESMRSTLAAKGLQGVDVRTGTATEMSLEDGWADAVIVAQVRGLLLYILGLFG